MSDISLLVLDEAHNTRGASSYAVLVQDFLAPCQARIGSLHSRITEYIGLYTRVCIYTIMVVYLLGVVFLKPRGRVTREHLGVYLFGHPQLSAGTASAHQKAKCLRVASIWAQSGLTRLSTTHASHTGGRQAAYHRYASQQLQPLGPAAATSGAAGLGASPPPQAPKVLALTASPEDGLHELLGCVLATATDEERCGTGCMLHGGHA
jgi:hypothetical protein